MWYVAHRLGYIKDVDFINGRVVQLLIKSFSLTVTVTTIICDYTLLNLVVLLRMTCHCMESSQSEKRTLNINALQVSAYMSPSTISAIDCVVFVTSANNVTVTVIMPFF